METGIQKGGGFFRRDIHPSAMIPRLVREAALVALGLSLLLGTSYAYTGTWPPAVIVESSSMMHPDGSVGYGRIGTMDPGDLVLVKRAPDAASVRTALDGGKEHYAGSGDVIVYRSGGGTGATPIIHRAIAYVEVGGTASAREYRVRWAPDAPCPPGAEAARGWCVFGEKGIFLPSHGIVTPSNQPYRPDASGFITKGDNPRTNQYADPVVGISKDAGGRPGVVRMEWIEGVARGEVPWIGLLRLSLGPTPNEDSPPASYIRVGNAYAPPDLWVMLLVALVAVFAGPVVVDAALRRVRRNADG